MTFAVLADECLPRVIVLELRGLGFDVRYAAETYVQASDEDLLAIARAESRIVLTEDFDFGELFPPGPQGAGRNHPVHAGTGSRRSCSACCRGHDVAGF